MRTTKGLVQRYGDKRTGNWMRSSRARVSRPSWCACPSRRTKRHESRDGRNDRWHGSLYQVDGREHQGRPGRSRGKRSLQQGKLLLLPRTTWGNFTGRHSMTGQIWCDVRPQRSRRHKATASSRYGRRRDVRSSFIFPLIGGLKLPSSRGLVGQRDQSDDEQHRFGVAHRR
jgi:hypothetical protein